MKDPLLSREALSETEDRIRVKQRWIARVQKTNTEWLISFSAPEFATPEWVLRIFLLTLRGELVVPNLAISQEILLPAELFQSPPSSHHKVWRPLLESGSDFIPAAEAWVKKDAAR